MDIKKELKEVLKEKELKLQQDRDANPDKTSCKGCTFEKEYHPFFCGHCSRYLLKEMEHIKSQFKTAQDLWMDARKYDVNCYFDSR